MHAECLVRFNLILLAYPLLDGSLDLFGGCGPLGLEYVAAQSAVYPCIMPIFPERAEIDLSECDNYALEPNAERPR